MTAVATSREKGTTEIDDDLDVAEFRQEVRTWLHENQPGQPPPLGSYDVRAWSAEWQRRQYDAGWAGIDWPAEYGGRGLSFLKQIVWFEEYVQSGLPIGRSCFVVALAHAGPTLIARGSEGHKVRYLPPILRGEEPWCQGFSEPGSGSDLASLSTRAEIDGDELVVNGQKVWTSYAHLADFQELLVRTDPAAPKHKGITWVICDMRSPGIEVRPIRTIDGGAHFSEVFYDNVRIPLTNVVDEINAGWSVAMSTLAIERGPAALDYQLGTLRDIDDLVQVAKDRGLLTNDELALRLAQARAEGRGAAVDDLPQPGRDQARLTAVADDDRGAHLLGRAAAQGRPVGDRRARPGVARARRVERVLAAPVLGGHRRRHEGHPEEHHRRARPGVAAMMHLALSPEQLEVAAVAEKFLSNELPLATVRALADADTPLAIDDTTWRRCADMGWFALGVPETRGGVGFGPVEEFALFRELGRHLTPGPFVSTVIAGWVAAATRDEPLAADLFGGVRRAGLVVDRYVYDGEEGGLAVRFDGDSVRLDDDLVSRSSAECRRVGPARGGRTG